MNWVEEARRTGTLALLNHTNLSARERVLLAKQIRQAQQAPFKGNQRWLQMKEAMDKANSQPIKLIPGQGPWHKERTKPR